MAQKIKRADLVTANKVVIIFDKSENVNKEGDILDTAQNVAYKKAPHEHLTNAYSKLVPHMMFATQLFHPETVRAEWFNDYEFLSDNRFDGIICTGIVMVGKDSNAVKLLGRKITEHGDVTAINSPIIRLEDETEKKYPLVHLLRDHLATALAELKLFQDGKWGAGTQLETGMKVAS